MAQSWFGIRASAALAILGSLLAFITSAALLWPSFGLARAGEAARFQMVMIALAVFCALLGVWGMATGIGILGRHPWARASALILAVLSVGMGFSALIAILFLVRAPSPDAARGIVVVALFYAGLAMVGAWWLVLFNSPGARLYFSTERVPRPLADDNRPFSITIVGGYLLLCAVATGTAAILRLPAVFFGWVVTGWATVAIYSAYTAIEIWLGSGVLGLQNASRVGALVFFALSGANAAVWGVLPDLSGRLLDLESACPRWLQNPDLMPTLDNVAVFVVAGLLYALVPAWFLFRRRAAFL